MGADDLKTPITMDSSDQRRGAPAAVQAMQWQMNSSFILPTWN